MNKEVMNGNISVIYEVECESDDYTYEIKISGPEIDMYGLPYISAESPENSVLSVSVYDTKFDEERLSFSMNKAQLESFFEIVGCTTVLEEKNVEFHNRCVECIYDAMYAMATYNANDVDMKHIRIYTPGVNGRSKIYVPYVKATYKAELPYKIVEKENNNKIVSLIYKDSEPPYTSIMITNDNRDEYKIIPLNELEDLEVYTDLCESITIDNTYSVSAGEINLDKVTPEEFIDILKQMEMEAKMEGNGKNI